MDRRVLAVVIAIAPALAQVPSSSRVAGKGASEMRSPVFLSHRPANRKDDISITAEASLGESGAKLAAEIIKNVDHLQNLRPGPEPKPDGVPDALRANEELIPKIFNIQVGELQAYETTQTDKEGVLRARWRASSNPIVSSIAVEDGFLDSVFVLECDASAVQDVASLLTSVLRWRSAPLGLNYLDVRVGEKLEVGNLALLAYSNVKQSPMGGGGQRFDMAAILKDGRLYLRVFVGNRLTKETAGALGYLAYQRFPPLSKSAPTWSTEAILRRIGELGHAVGPQKLFAADGPMLVQELVRRRASNDEIFLAVYGSTDSGHMRSRLMTGLATGVEQQLFTAIDRRPLLERILTLSAGDVNDCGYVSCASHVLVPWMRHSGLDLERAALHYAANAKDPGPALRYLGLWASSRATLEDLRRLPVSPDNERWKQLTIQQMSRRLEKSRRF